MLVELILQFLSRKIILASMSNLNVNVDATYSIFMVTVKLFIIGKDIGLFVVLWEL
jgi:hypothetical protein